MKLSNSFHYATVLGGGSALKCTPPAFNGILGSRANVVFASLLAENSIFQVPPGNIAFPQSPAGLHALCALEVEVADANALYSFGLFLPESWNGRFLAVGNASLAGGINWADMVANWGYRALHGSIVLGKELTSSNYGKDPAYSYYSGCSTGGRQGLKEAEMFPDDFDGVVAGAPAWWTSHLQLSNMKVGLYNLPVTAPHHIPSTMFPAIGEEVLKQCDPQDGLVDNIISDPARCDFRPEHLLCGPNVANATAAGCITSPQIDTLYHLYNDWVEANQAFIFPHFELESEAQWDLLVGGDEPSTLGTDYVKYLLGLGPDWRWQDFDQSIIALSDRPNPGNATANNFDLSPFHQKGGKLLHYHGHADGSIATGSSMYFYNHVLRTLKPKGIEPDNFYRFFLVPGMQHCAGTPPNMNAPWYFAGANQASLLGDNVHSVPGFSDAQHDVLLAMMAWVENGTAPTHIIGTKYENETLHDTVTRQRPLCMYPQQAKYSGEGDVNEASNWKCANLY